MAFSENNAKMEELRTFVAQNLPGCFLKSNRPYNKGAFVMDRSTGEMIAQADSNFKLLEKITHPGFNLERAPGFLPDSSICDFDAVYKSELSKLEDSINDSVDTAREWAHGKELRLMYDYEFKRFRLFVDNQAVVRRSK